MLPVMTVPAYAIGSVENAKTEVEYGSLWIEYYDMYSGDFLSSTIIHYEDLDNGAYSVEPQLISGYSLAKIAKYSGAAEGTPHDRATVSNGKWETIMSQTIEGVMPSSGAAVKYKVYYANDKADNGLVTVIRREKINEGEYTIFDKSVLYMDDFDANGIRVDVKVPGYKWIAQKPSEGSLQADVTIKWYKEGQFISVGNVYPPTMNDADVYALITYEGTAATLTLDYERDASSASFNSVLLLSENSSVPNATISYSIAPGTGIAAVPGTSMAVLAPSTDTGVTGTPTISNAVFSPGDATVTSVDGVTIDAGEKAVVKPISIDFSDVTFAQPGIFRYVISEPSSGNNMTYDTQLNDTTNGTRYQRVLDVYVVRNASDEYEIGGFVLHEVAGAVNEGETTAADKSSGFVTEYNTTGLTLECQVEGNQSSIDKYFAYTITMQNPGNSAFNVAADWANASGAQNPVANPATSYTNAVITAANTNEWTSNADGSMSKTIYLKDGQKVALDGIPVGTSYSVTVAEEDYGPSWVVGSDNASNDATGNRTLNAVEDVVFTLVREGVVPTGVALSILPGVILMGAAAAFFFVMKNRKREEASEA